MLRERTTWLCNNEEVLVLDTLHWETTQDSWPNISQVFLLQSRRKTNKRRNIVLVSRVIGHKLNKMTGSSTPVDMINLRLILVSGKTKEFLFSPNHSAADIAKHVYDNWPMDWEEEQVSSPNILRLIYQGRFLHGNVTLGALKLPLGKTTVMHLVARETLPEPNSQGQRNREKTGESNCCVIL